MGVVSGQGTAITPTPAADKHLLHIFSVQQGHSMRFQQHTSGAVRLCNPSEFFLTGDACTA